ncbi:MAG: RdgB/HAM1 family non-canonical purine NTP pyrophosphatase [Candidatus Binatia bacterium]
MSPPTLLIATTNAGKVREFAQLLEDLPLRLRSLVDLPLAPAVPEDGLTYAANAVGKAVTISQWSGCATLADDSGLEVDALLGAPGVHSARYAGAEQSSRANVRKLLDELRGLPPVERTARFRCVVVVATPDCATLTAEGSCEGRIIEVSRGSGGFGYDPVFLYLPLERTFAEMPAAMKNAVSHRAQACAGLRADLIHFLSVHAAACAGCRLD